MPIILDGKALADKICLELKERADKLKASGVFPVLTIVTSGGDAASKLYMRNKVRRAEEIGIEVNVIHHDDMYFDDVTEACMEYQPVIFQLPINGDVTLEVLNFCMEDPRHDMDGFVSDANVAALASGRKPHCYPCTPKGIMRLLSEYNIALEGKSVCIIGRSNIVSRPLARMMEQANATVTVCHSKTTTNKLNQALKMADIIVSATGQKDLLNLEMFAKYAIQPEYKVIVDVGMNRDGDGKLCGDCDKWLYECSYAYTPVPGGVGPMTVAMLMENVIEYYERDL